MDLFRACGEGCLPVYSHISKDEASPWPDLPRERVSLTAAKLFCWHGWTHRRTHEWMRPLDMSRIQDWARGWEEKEREGEEDGNKIDTIERRGKTYIQVKRNNIWRCNVKMKNAPGNGGSASLFKEHLFKWKKTYWCIPLLCYQQHNEIMPRWKCCNL